MILVNGEEIGHIACTDRGFQYGDGIFETIEVQNSRPVFLMEHLQRLETGCSTLRIPIPNIQLLTDEINFVCKRANRAVLKIIITRGSGGRGYRPPDALHPTRVLSLHPYPEYPSTYISQGINARFCDTRLGLNPTLAGLKHLNRLEQIMARAEWDDPDIQEGIMLDINNHVIEGTMTNLFYVKSHVVYTAVLDLSGVAGILRGLIKNLIKEHGLTLTEHDYFKEALLNADEIFVCNSIIGIWPVKNLDNICLPVGNITHLLQGWLFALKEKVSVEG